ncbi:MAG: hypothetical protein GXP43_00880 [bacterium]|nr:hypothetical protein [bacterium]
MFNVYADETIKVGAPKVSYFDNVGQLISGVMTMAIIFGALAVFVYLIWGGFEWLTSGGDSGKIENAQKKITSALIGFAIVAASYGLIKLIGALFGFDFFTNGLPIKQITTPGATK